MGVWFMTLRHTDCEKRGCAGSKTPNQMQTESLYSCPNTASPVPLNSLTSTPRFGTVTPNRVFVGGIDFKTNENDLRKFFAQYGSVKEVKIVNDRAGVSKGYGFITFETQEDAQKILQEAKKLNFRDKKLNIGPAIRKQQIRNPRTVIPEAATMYLTTSSGYPYIYHNGVAYFHTSEVASVQQPWPSRSVSSSPVMVAQPVYQSPTYQYQAPSPCVPSQWQWSVPQSAVSSPSFLYVQPSEVVYQPIGITQESGCVPPPLLVEAAAPEVYSDHGVQAPHHQPIAQNAIAMPAPVSIKDTMEHSVLSHLGSSHLPALIFLSRPSCVAEIHHRHSSSQLPAVELAELRLHSVRRNFSHHSSESETSMHMKSPFHPRHDYRMEDKILLPPSTDCNPNFIFF